MVTISIGCDEHIAPEEEMTEVKHVIMEPEMCRKAISSSSRKPQLSKR